MQVVQTAGVPPNLTECTPMTREPVITTWLPPETGPFAGLTAVTTGAR